MKRQRRARPDSPTPSGTLWLRSNLPMLLLVALTAGLVVGWAIGYARPIDASVTLRQNYRLRCDRGTWQLWVERYSRVAGMEPSGRPVIERDARRVRGDYRDAWDRQRAWFKPAWPPLQSGSALSGTSRVYAVKTGAGVEVEVHEWGASADIYAVPCWLPLALCGIGGAGLAWRRRAAARRGRRAAGLCVTCGYDLRATPARCPECGAEPAADAPSRDGPRVGRLVLSAGSGR